MKWISFFNSEVEDQIKKNENIEKNFKDKVYHDGKKAESVASVFFAAGSMYKHLITELLTYKQNILEKKIQEYSQNVAVEEKKLQGWLDKQMAKYQEHCKRQKEKHEVVDELMDIGKADIIMKPNKLLWLAYACFVAEGLLCFQLVMDALADFTFGNILVAAIVALVLMIISAAFHSVAHYLPRSTKYVLFVLLAISSLVFIYYVTDLRTPTSIQDVMSMTSDSEVSSSPENNFIFQLSLIFTLMFAGLSLSWGIREPKDAYIAKQYIDAYRPLRRQNAILSSYVNSGLEIDHRLAALRKIGVSGFVDECFVEYFEGLKKKKNSYSSAYDIHKEIQEVKKTNLEELKKECENL